MTPEEIQRTMDFILRSQADSVVGMERMKENMEAAHANFQKQDGKLQEQLDILAAAARDLVKVSRRHEKRIARL